MKKTLVALTIAAFAASASAVTVYDNEGTKVSVGGRVHYTLDNVTKDGKRADVRNNGSRVSVRAEHTLAEGYKALGYVEVGVGDDTVNTRRTWVGFSADNIGTLTFGRQLTNGDGLGLSDFTNLYGGVNQVTGSGAKVVKFTSAEFNGFTFGADYLFGSKDRAYKATEGFKSEYRNGYGVGVFYAGKVNDALTLKANAGYSAETYDLRTRESEQRRAWTVATGLDYAQFSFGVDYTEARDTSKTDNLKLIFDKGRGAFNHGETKARILEVGAKYNVLDNLNVYTAYKHGRGYNNDNTVKGRYNEGILGTTYFFNKNVRTYVEGAVAKTNVTSNGVKTSYKDNKIGVGLRLDF